MAPDGITTLVRICHLREEIQPTLFRRGFREMVLLVEIFGFWFERGLVYCRFFRVIILRTDPIRD